MKDMLSGHDSFAMREADMQVVLELVGYEDNKKVEYILGEWQESLFKIIQDQIQRQQAEARLSNKKPTQQVYLGGAAEL